MSVTVEHLNQPTQDVEKKIEDAAPAAVKPEVDLIEQEFNAVAGNALKEAPTEEKAAEAVPEVAKLAEDVKNVFDHKAVPSGVLFSEATSAVKEVRRGYKTTEFWGAVAIYVLTFTGTVHIPGKYGDAITQAATGAAYILSRGLAKH